MDAPLDAVPRLHLVAEVEVRIRRDVDVDLVPTPHQLLGLVLEDDLPPADAGGVEVRVEADAYGVGRTYPGGASASRFIDGPPYQIPESGYSGQLPPYVAASAFKSYFRVPDSPRTVTTRHSPSSSIRSQRTSAGAP